MRRLSLHASALSDAEYDLYTASLKEISLTNDERDTSQDDGYFERITIGIREARAWLRGRYSHVSAADIDNILKYFSPTLGPNDTLSGGQFFVVLRLVVHVESGKDLDRALAFVQARPALSPLSSPPKRLGDDPPPMPTRRTFTEPAATATHSTTKSSLIMSDNASTNPFFQPTTLTRPQPPTHPSQQAVPLESHLTPTESTNNPFMSRNKSFSTRSENGNNKLPPLPPRKPPPLPPHSNIALLPPPRHGSTQKNHSSRSKSPSRIQTLSTPLTSSITNPMAHFPPPVPPPKPAAHVTSNLIKQSLQASKAAKSMKKAEEQLEKERVLQVLKSSSAISGAYSLAGATVTSSSVVIGTSVRNRSISPTKFVYSSTASSSSQTSISDDRAPPLPKRRTQHRPSPPMSSSSLEQVALATTSSTGMYVRTRSPNQFVSSPFTSLADQSMTTSTRSSSASASPSRPMMDLPSGPPPTHPDRKTPHSPYYTPSVFTDSSTSPSHTPKFRFQQMGRTETFDAVYGPTSSPAGSTSFPSSNKEDSPTTRVFRSKSMHQPSPPPPPIPPPLRRKRPESVQVLSTNESIFDSPTYPSENTELSNPKRSSLSRHMSLSAATMSGQRRSSVSGTSNSSGHSHPSFTQANPTLSDSPMSNIQRTLATLQPKLESLQIQPRLEKVRYKAEAGLSRRGFIRDGGKSGTEGEEESLVSGQSRNRGGGNFMGGGLIHDEPDVDDGEADWKRNSTHDRDGMSAGAISDDDDWGSGVGRRHESEQDNLKWPTGEGWKPL